jgi:hypothetical protein
MNEGNETTKVVDGRIYHWCDHHGIWTGHSTKDCRAAKQKKKRKQTDKDKNKDPGAQVTALQVAKALTAIAEAPGQESDDEDA